jgi:aryl-alcohol dehydrogenase-like predicted oxidoreductase
LEIFTKVFWPTGPGPNDRGLSCKHIMESIDGSLRRLQTDYVDLYQFHRYDWTTPLEESMVAVADLVRAGKVLYVGVSNGAEQVREAHALAADLRIHLVSNQPQYSMLWRVIEPEVIPACEELGIGQIVWSPIAQGVLTGNSAGPAATRGLARHRRQVRRDVHPPVQRERRGVGPRSAAQADRRAAGLTMAQLAVAWVLQHPNVSSAIVGASRPEQVRDNVKAAGVRLTPAFSRRSTRSPSRSWSAIPARPTACRCGPGRLSARRSRRLTAGSEGPELDRRVPGRARTAGQRRRPRTPHGRSTRSRDRPEQREEQQHAVRRDVVEPALPLWTKPRVQHVPPSTPESVPGSAGWR